MEEMLSSLSSAAFAILVLDCGFFIMVFDVVNGENLAFADLELYLTHATISGIHLLKSLHSVNGSCVQG